MASAATAAVRPLDRTRARRKAAWRRRRLVLLLMAPWLIGFSVFFGYPLVMSVYLSFTHYDLLSSPKWIGTANYRYLFTQDPQVGQAAQAGDASVLNLGYPEDSTLFYPVMLYQQGFRYFNMGYASAMAMLLLVVAFAVTLFIVLNSRRFVHYHGAVR